MADVVERYRIVGENQVGAALNQILRQSKSTAEKMAGLFKFAFAGVSLLTVGRMVAQTIQFNDALARGAIKSGIAAHAFTELAFAARQADVEQGALETGLKKMQISLSNASTGGKAQKEVLEALGIAYEDISQLAPDKQFELIAEQISKIKDPADRTRAAVELFGRAGADLLPLFEQGAEGIRQAREEAERLGRSLSAEDLQRFQEADDAFKRLKESGGSLADTLVLKTSPALIGLANAARIALGGATDLERLQIKVGQLVDNKAKFGTPEGQAEYTRMRALIDSMERATLLPSHGARLHGEGPPAPGFGAASEEMQKARLEIMALGGPTEKLTAQFLAQKQKLEELAKTYPALAGAAGAAIQRLSRDYTIALDEANAGMAELISNSAAINQGYLTNAIGPTAEQNAADLSATMSAINEENIQIRDRTIEVGVAYDFANDKATKLMETIQDEMARQAFTTIRDLIYDLGNGADQFADKMINAIKSILADYATQQLFGLFADFAKGHAGGGGFFGTLMSGISAMFGGGRGATTVAAAVGGGSSFHTVGMPRLAGGGYIPPGGMALVGEDGPEFAFGGRGGKTITPMRGGGRAVHVTMDARTYIDAKGASAELQKVLPGILDKHADRIEGRVVERIRRQIYRF